MNLRPPRSDLYERHQDAGSGHLLQLSDRGVHVFLLLFLLTTSLAQQFGERIDWFAIKAQQMDSLLGGCNK